MVQLPVYIDYNATTPCDPEVVQAMLPYFTNDFGNAASRSHVFGWKAAAAVEEARELIADFIGADRSEIIFTSGATESSNLALKGIFEMYSSRGQHIITTRIEHKAVLDTCKHLEKQGAEITYVTVNKEGLIDIEEIKAAVKSSTILIAVIYANNEIGVIQPMEQISQLAKEKGILFFSDATQAVGKIPVQVLQDGIDVMAFSAHKLYGPKGIGALYVRRKNPRVRLAAQMDGGGHEKGWRSGTLNVPGIVGFGRACALCREQMESEGVRLSRLRNKLEKSLLSLEESYVNGSREYRLPHVTNISFAYVEGSALLTALNKDIALSSGSACTSASLEPSYVLKALGLGDDLARSSLRFSLGRFSDEEQVDYVVKKVKETVQQLRENSPLWTMFRAGVALDSDRWHH